MTHGLLLEPITSSSFVNSGVVGYAFYTDRFYIVASLRKLVVDRPPMPDCTDLHRQFVMVKADDGPVIPDS